MKLLFLAIIISFPVFCFAQQSLHNIDKKLLYGRWTSEEDNKYFIVVSATSISEFYDKEKTGSFSYTIKKDKLTETDKSTCNVSNYQIITLTKQRFNLIYLERGNVLKFRRRQRWKRNAMP